MTDQKCPNCGKDPSPDLTAGDLVHCGDRVCINYVRGIAYLRAAIHETKFKNAMRKRILKAIPANKAPCRDCGRTVYYKDPGEYVNPPHYEPPMCQKCYSKRLKELAK